MVIVEVTMTAIVVEVGIASSVLALTGEYHEQVCRNLSPIHQLFKTSCKFTLLFFMIHQSK